MATTTAPRARAKRSRAAESDAATPQELIAIAQDVTSNVLVERVGEMRIITLGALAGKNIHLDGPPGTAKSLGLREFCKRIGAGEIRHFEKTVHPQMPADALIGGYDMEKLLSDSRLERKVEGYLPGADTGFVDEITRSNGPVTDALLPLMNTTERLYEANGKMARAPLLFFVSAANFMPDPSDPQLGAFVDRFTLMCKVEYIKSDDSFMDLVRRDQTRRASERAGQPPAVTVTLAKFKAAQLEVLGVEATEQEFLEAFAKLRREASSEGLVVSDRRWLELLDVARAAAWLAGRKFCITEDLAAMQAGLWRIHAEIPIAHKLVLPFKSTFEQDAAKHREEAQEAIDTHTRLRPIVEGTPPTQQLNQEVVRELTNAGRAMADVYRRAKTKLDDAERQQRDAPALRELIAELDQWREWRLNNDLPARW